MGGWNRLGRRTAACAVGLTLAACGQSPHSNPRVDGAVAGVTAPPFAGAPGGAAGQPPNGAPGVDSEVDLHVATYSAGDPCAGVPTTIGTPFVPQRCQDGWRPFRATVVPGADVMSKLSLPAKARVAQPVASEQGADAATAYLRASGFQLWAEQLNVPQAALALDPRVSPLYNFLRHGGSFVASSPCELPVALRVVGLNESEQAALRAGGWTHPSSRAVVAIYPPCQFPTVRDASGGEHHFSVPQEVTVVASGTVVDRAPFGRVWAVDGVAACGDPALRSACGE